MKTLTKKILIGSSFVFGLVGAISGDFIIASALFATAAVASNVNPTQKDSKVLQLLWD